MTTQSTLALTFLTQALWMMRTPGCVNRFSVREFLLLIWPEVTPRPNISSLPCCNLNTSTLFHHREEGLAMKDNTCYYVFI